MKVPLGNYQFQIIYPQIFLHFQYFFTLSYCFQWCCEAPTVPNGVGVRPDTHPNALGKRWGNYLYISIQKRPVYADKLRASPSVLHKIDVNWW